MSWMHVKGYDNCVQSTPSNKRILWETDFAQCKQAASKMNLTFAGKDMTNDYPKGCYQWTTNGQVYFGTNAKYYTQNRGDANPICRLNN